MYGWRFVWFVYGRNWFWLLTYGQVWGGHVHVCNRVQVMCVYCVGWLVVKSNGKMQIHALTCEMFTQGWCKLWRTAPREWCLRQIRERDGNWEKPSVHPATYVYCINQLYLYLIYVWNVNLVVSERQRSWEVGNGLIKALYIPKSRRVN